MSYKGFLWAFQWADPRTFVGFAEELTIGSLVVAGVTSVLLARRRRYGLAVALLACSVAFSITVRAGRVVDPRDYRVDRDKVAVVTGGNQGIGKATVQLLAEAGYTVVLCARDPELGEEAAAEIREVVPDAHIVVFRLNLSTLAGVQQFASSLASRFAKIDVLVLNAGLGFVGASEPLTKVCVLCGCVALLLMVCE
jgi:hypothetical protein